MSMLSRTIALSLAPALLISVPAPVFAQSAPAETVDARLRRLEGELRAVQRKVFPDGAGRTFAPEIVPGGQAAAPVAPAASASALADVMTRMDAVEAQMKALTAASEDNQNRIAKLDTRITTLESAAAAAAAAATPPPAPVAAPAPEPAPAAPPPAKPARPAAKGKAADKPADAAPAATSPTPVTSADAEARARAIAALDRPATDDKGEDAYSYGYRLWEAKFLPEAQTALSDFVKTYPHHKRISYARNLLGRAYLDDGKPGAAAQWFMQNYQADKQADRAPDSLLFLAVAMIRLKETKRACIALGEFQDTYPTEAEGRLKGQYDAVSKSVTCR